MSNLYDTHKNAFIKPPGLPGKPFPVVTPIGLTCPYKAKGGIPELALGRVGPTSNLKGELKELY